MGGLIPQRGVVKILSRAENMVKMAVDALKIKRVRLSEGMTMKIARMTFVLGLFWVTACAAEEMRACFTPGEDCTDEIVSEIDQAEKSILMQAYGFSSPPIAHALMNAHGRGVDVRVILDKSQRKQKCVCDGVSCVAIISYAGIPVLIDTIKGIAHNKVMVIDGKKVITGSFNFTKSAQKRNAENVVVITSEEMAAKYTNNWHKREERSVEYEPSGCE